MCRDEDIRTKAVVTTSQEHATNYGYLKLLITSLFVGLVLLLWTGSLTAISQDLDVTTSSLTDPNSGTSKAIKALEKVSDSGWLIQTVDSPGNVGKYTSLQLDSQGYAHIAYYREYDRDLKYAYQDASGWHSRTVSSIGSVGTFASLRRDSYDNPHVAYRDATNQSFNVCLPHYEWLG
jgi:hypothetical protein